MTKLLLTPVTSGKTIDVKVRARNMAGNYSTFNTTQQVIVPASTSLPSTPTSLSASSDPLAITLFWTNPSNKDLKSVEIYYSTSSSGTKNLIGSIDAVRSANQEYNLVYDSVTFSQNQTYYFTVRAVNTSAVASSYTSEVTAAFASVNTSDITLNAVSGVFNSVVSSSVTGESTTQDSISYFNGSSVITLNGFMCNEITLGTIPSTVAGLLINANAMASKRTIATSKYAYAIVLQKLPSNSYYEKATDGGNFCTFLGSGDATSQSSTEGIQGNYSTSFIDSATGVTGTTGTKYALFLYETTETTDQYWIFGGSGLTVTELKR
jgi:hypothetical protein